MLTLANTLGIVMLLVIAKGLARDNPQPEQSGAIGRQPVAVGRSIRREHRDGSNRNGP